MTSRSSSFASGDSSSRMLERFKDDFIFKLATNERERLDVFHLRHEVYCEELGYEQPTDISRKIEYDEHDRNSIHCLIVHRKSGISAGCMRLVLPDPTNHCASSKLPLQNYAGQSLTHQKWHPEHLDRAAICEVSRLAISPLFRKRSANAEIAESLKSRHPFTDDERRTFPVILIGLFLATYALVGLTERRHVFAMMEPRLPRLLSMSGFNFTKVGGTINFHGKRSAFYIDQHQAEKEMHENLMPLYLYIQQKLAPQLEAAMPHRRLATTTS